MCKQQIHCSAKRALTAQACDEICSVIECTRCLCAVAHQKAHSHTSLSQTACLISTLQAIPAASRCCCCCCCGHCANCPPFYKRALVLAVAALLCITAVSADAYCSRAAVQHCYRDTMTPLLLLLLPSPYVISASARRAYYHGTTTQLLLLMMLLLQQHCTAGACRY